MTVPCVMMCDDDVCSCVRVFVPTCKYTSNTHCSFSGEVHLHAHPLCEDNCVSACLLSFSSDYSGYGHPKPLFDYAHLKCVFKMCFLVIVHFVLHFFEMMDFYVTLFTLFNI